MATRRAGRLITRAWVEDESGERLRAQIGVAEYLITGVHRFLTLGQPDTVAEALDGRLHTTLTAAPTQINDHGPSRSSHAPVPSR
jgi:hypothetical protein